MNCSKIKFSDERQAQYFLDRKRRTGSTSFRSIRVYLCDQCWCWHLTSKTQDQVDYELKTIHDLRLKLWHQVEYTRELEHKLELLRKEAMVKRH